jgi:hypothetical protein
MIWTPHPPARPANWAPSPWRDPGQRFRFRSGSTRQWHGYCATYQRAFLDGRRQAPNPNPNDLIKIDIEGGEWSALDGMIAGGKRLPLTQALIEFHVIQPQSSIETMAGLQALGMQVFHVEENNYCTTCYNTKARGKYYEVSFANTHKDGSLFLRPQQG